MATSWKSQQGKGEYALQFETDDEGKYKLVEKAAQMAMDRKTEADYAEVKHGEWKERFQIIMDSEIFIGFRCTACNLTSESQSLFCPNCGADMRGEANSSCYRRGSKCKGYRIAKMDGRSDT